MTSYWMKLKRGLADVGDVVHRTGEEVVDGDHLHALVQQVVAEMRADEAGPAGDDRAHGSPSLSLVLAVVRDPRPHRIGRAPPARSMDQGRQQPDGNELDPQDDQNDPEEQERAHPQPPFDDPQHDHVEVEQEPDREEPGAPAAEDVQRRPPPPGQEHHLQQVEKAVEEARRAELGAAEAPGVVAHLAFADAEPLPVGQDRDVAVHLSVERDLLGRPRAGRP